MTRIPENSGNPLEPAEVLITCIYCNQATSIPMKRLSPSAGCPHCGNILYEIDDMAGRNLRYTKNFIQYYQKLTEYLREVKHQTGSTENARKLCQIIERQLPLCDNETRDSAGSMFPFILDYLNAFDQQDPSLKEKEKNMNSFIRMMDTYLHLRR